ncbi:GrpB family protein [Priestia filamentosa]|uniref:GrpB family protein n=1 Tax=Priestia filamentosa TaxID=1402861 RepID=UPI001FB4F792|nr:GrpB family protein [Priestia filamentosa]MED3727214.1 GrpB family protein [Priestia filamentosa]UOE59415.1 GrpB family protein [Priestia filamentosa]
MAKVQLVPYDAQWPEKFRVLKEQLEEKLAPMKVSIEHIGSTSVPNMMAKPIIDVIVGVEKEEELQYAIDPIRELGYTYVQQYETILPNRRYFVRFKEEGLPDIIRDGDHDFSQDADFHHEAHLHVVVKGSNLWERHLQFRDILRSSEDSLEAYASVKRKLALREWESTNEYAKAKTSVITGILSR